MVLALAAGLANASDETINPPAPVGFSSGVELDFGADEPPPPATEPLARQSNTPAPEKWWRESDASPLRVTQAGPLTNPPDGQPAIGLLLNGGFARGDNFNDYLTVYAEDGQRLQAHWQRSASPNLLYYSVPGPGTYWVRIRAGLRADNGDALRSTLAGPVRIKPSSQENGAPIVR